MCGDSAENLFSALIKPASIMEKDRKKDLLNVFMNFDLDQKKIFFDTLPYSGGNEKTYFYFPPKKGNNLKYYSVSLAKNIMDFWNGKGILYNIFEMVTDCKLKKLLEECQKSALFNEKGICETAIQFREALGKVEFEVKRDKADTGLYINGDKVSPDKFINLCLEDESNGKFVLIIPQIIKNGEPPICISQDEAYLTAINRSLQGKSRGSMGVCHVCGKRRNDINTVEYTTKFKDINKVFVTKIINYSSFFNRNNYNKNYSLCQSCYKKLLHGEKNVKQDYKIQVAGEDCLLLFDGLIDNIDIEYLPKLSSNIDAVFNHKEFDQSIKDLLYDFDLQGIATYRGKKIHLYEFNMIFYKQNNNSTKVTKTIESVSRIRFEEVNDAFDKIFLERFDKFLTYFSLANIYRMIPVSTNSKGEQLDIGRVLDFYSGILKGEAIDKHVIFDFATEALEKGIRAITSAELRNYTNLYKIKIFREKFKEYLNKKEKPIYNSRDFYSAEIVMMYLALIEVLQDLKILNVEVCKVENDSDMFNGKFKECEEFLARHNFNVNQRSLFYIGVLTNQIGYAQAKQGHYLKPIFNKISYSGMSKEEIENFYIELGEKVQQYKSASKLGNEEEKVDWFNRCMEIQNKIHENIGVSNNFSTMSDKENVFYLMSGYSFYVKYWNNKIYKDNKGADNNDSSKE